ncbi:MAG: tetratricopeptide repeat protein [Planctomycetes bacterium]|nr:tetratricopeptide repeat protein [Planctomycetota bacterium]
MSIRTKTKKRLLILLAIVVVATGMGVALVVYTKQRNEAQAAVDRAEGMAAVKAEDWDKALDHLGHYWRRNKDDAEAMYNFALARLHVELPNGKHIQQAIQILQRVVQLDDNNVEAMHKLLEIYVAVGFETEVSDLSDKLLAIKPDDIDALRSKVIALMRGRKFKEAMQFNDRAAKVQPEDLQTQTNAILIMSKLDQPPLDLIKRAQGVREKFPDNPRMDVLMAFAYALTNDRTNAVEWIKKAAAAAPPDADYVRIVSDQLDAMGLFPDSLAMLQKNAAELKDVNIIRKYARRLWQNNRYQDILTLLKDYKAEDRDSASDLLALKAMSLIRDDKKDEAMAIVDALAKRTGDNGALAWVPVLRDVFIEKPKDIQQVVKICRDGISASPGDPFIRMFLAEAYAQLGENEQAIEQWEAAAQYATAWAQPHIRMAMVYSSTNRARQALQEAQQALLRAPDNVGAVVSLANAWSQLIDAGVGDDTKDKLLELLTQVQKAAPGEPNTIGLYVQMLARTGKVDQAKKVITDALAAKDKPLPEQTLLQLASISRDFKLGLEEQLFAMSADKNGTTANLAYGEAVFKLTNESKEAALAYLQPLVEKNGKDDVSWQIAWARFLDQVGDDRAKAAWIAIGDANPNNLHIQRMILGMGAVQSDRAFMDRTIERVKSQSTDEGLTWQLARARWYLTGEDSQRDPTKAVTMLNDIVKRSPDLIEPRILLATAMQQLDNTGAAIDQLKAASDLQPQNVAIKLELARLNILQGDFTAAQNLVDLAMKDKDLSDVQRQQVAAMLAQMGQSDRAITLLGAEGEKPTLMRAELLFRRSQLKEADEEYQKLLKSAPSPQVVQSYANFLGATGRVDDAMQVMALFKKMKLTPGTLEMLNGEFYRRFGSSDLAAENFEAALKIIPDKPLAWRTLIDFYASLGEADKAMDANDRALKANAGDKLFSLIKNQSAVIKPAIAVESLRPMVSALVKDDDNREAAMAVLRTMQDKTTDSQSLTAHLLALRKLADKNPRFMALQMLLIDENARYGKFEDALSLASRAMEAFPTEADPAERATRLLERLGRWNEVISTGQQWRERTLNQPLLADAEIANAYLNTNQPAKAIAQVERYRAFAMAQPTRLPGIIAVYARGLIGLNQTEEAAKLLKPLLPTAPQWRALWTQLAAQAIKDTPTVATWFERVEAVTPADAIAERVVIANDWYILGARTNNDAYKKKGMEQLRGLATLKDADVGAIISYAMLLYQAGDINGAEAEYRRALEVKPDLSTAQNNLAVLIADKNGNLDEALTLAKMAVESNPTVATFHDTLAHVYSARKNYEQAVASLRSALKIEPESIEWRVNLIAALINKGDKDEAKRMLNDLDALNPDVKSMPTDLRKRIDDARTALQDKQAQAAN